MLYCPWCGKPLNDLGGVLTCIPGNMPLSPDFQRVLKARYLDRSALPAATVVTFRAGPGFHCPGCGRALGEPDGTTCGTCGLSIHDLLRTIVELHPHGLDR